MSTPSAGVIVVLRALAQQSPRALTAHDLGFYLNSTAEERGQRGIGQRGSRYIGPGALAAPVIRAASNRGLITLAIREDDLSGAAWRLTAQGQAVLDQVDGKGPDWDGMRAAGWSGCMHDSDCACSNAVMARDAEVLRAFPVRS